MLSIKKRNAPAAPKAPTKKRKKILLSSTFYAETQNVSALINILKLINNMQQNGDIIMNFDEQKVTLHLQTSDATTFGWFELPGEFFDTYEVDAVAVEAMGQIYVDWKHFYDYMCSGAKSKNLSFRIDKGNVSAKLFAKTDASEFEIPLREPSMNYLPAPNRDDFADCILASVRVNSTKLNDVIEMLKKQKLELYNVRVLPDALSFDANSRTKGVARNTIRYPEDIESIEFHQGKTLVENLVGKKTLGLLKLAAFFKDVNVNLDFMDNCILADTLLDEYHSRYIAALPVRASDDDNF